MNASFQKLVFLFYFLLILFCSCKKEKSIQLNWQEITSPTSLTLNSITFTSDSIGHIVGGDRWFEGVYLISYDAGQTWLIDSLSQKKEAFKIRFNSDKNGFAVGIGGDFYFKETPQSNWQFHNVTFPNESFRDVSFWDKENGYVVTGGAFRGGKIIRVDELFKGEIIDSFDQELSTIYHSTKDIIHILGYGIILRSNDGGATWENKGITGDFFRDLHFPTSQIGYAVGHSGSIIKTTNGGATWDFLRNGDQLGTSNKPFRAVFFINENYGYVVGEKGVFWKTENGGEDWKTVEDFPEVDLHDVFIKNDIGFAVGKNGKIFSFTI